jgi:hypothetical protein
MPNFQRQSSKVSKSVHKFVLERKIVSQYILNERKNHQKPHFKLERKTYLNAHIALQV